MDKEEISGMGRGIPGDREDGGGGGGAIFKHSVLWAGGIFC